MIGWTWPAAGDQLRFIDDELKKANAALGGGRIEALFMEGYREFIFLPSAKQSYRTLFLSLADKQMAPGVFHCTTGKDRTGWAAAALLMLLGVPTSTKGEEYKYTGSHRIRQWFQGGRGSAQAEEAAEGLSDRPGRRGRGR
ncbi:MAG: tyrosine-protein phosphatase [Desulfobacterales bacterium]